MSKSIRLLIVDDFAADVMVYYRYILRSKPGMPSNAEYDIITAETGTRGLQLYKEEHPDCVLLDYSLPDMTGLEFLDEIHEQSGIGLKPIILATGYEDPGVQIQAEERGVAGYYIKGKDSAERLVTLLDNALTQ